MLGAEEWAHTDVSAAGPRDASRGGLGPCGGRIYLEMLRKEDKYAWGCRGARRARALRRTRGALVAEVQGDI